MFTMSVAAEGASGSLAELPLDLGIEDIHGQSYLALRAGGVAVYLTECEARAVASAMNALSVLASALDSARQRARACRRDAGRRGGLMKFTSDDETLAAMLVTAKWLPELVRRTEAGVEAMGLTIEKRLSARYEDGTVDPVLVLKGRRAWKLELHLRNAFEDFLLAEREVEPPRLDTRLLDDSFAETKLADVVAGRLAIVKTIAESRTARDARRNIEKTARHFEWLRIWEHER
jgi:hypothetical protein